MTPRQARLLVGCALAVVISIAAARTPMSDGASELPANTWVNLKAGGIAAGRGVGDEGFSTFVYSPGQRRALVFGQYHALEVSWGEDQNALLAYDFSQNRWDLVEVTEDAWSEFLPGHGHDQGNVALDTVHDLYITAGNMTLHGNTAYSTYVYDLRAGRGKRMLPPREAHFGESTATAFDPDHDLVLSTKGPSAIYDHNVNTWTEIPNSPSHRASPGLVYDTKHKLFVMFGGARQSETWVFDPAQRRWSRRSPARSPSERVAPNMAFDARNGVTLLVGGASSKGDQLSDVWIYDAGADAWTPLSVAAPPTTNPGAGNNLTYDSDHGVFLLKSTVDLRDVWAFRYVPASAARSSLERPDAPSAVVRGEPSGDDRAIIPVAMSAEVPKPFDLQARKWIARKLPSYGKGVTAGKHVRLAHNPENGRIYVLGGDYDGPHSESQGGRREIYSYGVADNSWRLEHPYCTTSDAVQPANPDEVGWAYDRNRRLFWMLPGHLIGGAWDDPCPTGLVKNEIMTFDPQTRKWTRTGKPIKGYGERFKFAVYDPVTDHIIRFYYGASPISQHYDVRAGTYTEYQHGLHDATLADARLGEEYAAIDVDGRVVWIIEPVQGRLYRYDIDQRKLRLEATTPAQNPRIRDIEKELWPWDCAMPVWDSINRVLLWPHIRDFSTAGSTGRPGDGLQLYIYHPGTKTWEKETMMQPDGLPVRGNAAVFDPGMNALLVLGGTYPANHHLFIYRYAGETPVRAGVTH